MREKKTRYFVVTLVLFLVCVVALILIPKQEEEISTISIEELFEDSNGNKQYEGHLVRTKGQIFGGWGSSNEMLLAPFTDNPSWLVEVFLSGSETRLVKQWEEVIRMKVHNVSIEGRVYYTGFYGMRLLDATIIEPFLDLWIVFELAPDILAAIAFVIFFVFVQIARKTCKRGFSLRLHCVSQRFTTKVKLHS